MIRLTIGEALAARLYAAETAIDAALTESATLTAMLPVARADAYLSAVTGQRVFDEAAATISALSAARAHLVHTHNALAAVARKLGLDALASGPVDKPGEVPPLDGGGVTTGTFPDVVNKTLPLSSFPC